MQTLEDATPRPVAPSPREPRRGRPRRVEVARRRRAVRPLLVALLVVLASELGVRALDLPTPLVFSSVEAQIKAEELRATGPGRIDTVFVGSSVLDVAVQPDRFATAAGLDGDAYNAALLGADMRSLELWVEHVVVPAVAPKRVVFGLNCRELNGAEDAQDAYFAEFTLRAGRWPASSVGRPSSIASIDRSAGGQTSSATGRCCATRATCSSPTDASV